jgi:hypothetical protein
MARIRTIKPEFWEDDVIGSLSRDARLLFIATLNLADDEGLLRWSAAYLKASAFMYDDDVSIKTVEKLMAELLAPGLLFEYRAGKSQQPFAYVVNFHKHQRINRPTPSKLVPPSLQNREVKEMYARRDGWVCHLCGGRIDQTSHQSSPDFELSMDHLVPVSHGGADFPSNIKASHVTCNKGRKDKSVDEYRAILRSGSSAAQVRHSEAFNERLTEEVTEPVKEVLSLGREGKGIGKEEGVLLTPKSASELLTFWDAYPRKVGKGAAKKALQKATRKTPFSEILAGLKATKFSDDPKFIPYPATWLNEERWSDPPEVPVGPDPRADPHDTQWRARLNGYKPGGYWPDVWGSRPGEPGCVAPAALLREYGL